MVGGIVMMLLAVTVYMPGPGDDPDLYPESVTLGLLFGGLATFCLGVYFGFWARDIEIKEAKKAKKAKFLKDNATARARFVESMKKGDSVVLLENLKGPDGTAVLEEGQHVTLYKKSTIKKGYWRATLNGKEFKLLPEWLGPLPDAVNAKASSTQTQCYEETGSRVGRRLRSTHSMSAAEILAGREHRRLAQREPPSPLQAQVEAPGSAMLPGCLLAIPVTVLAYFLWRRMRCQKKPEMVFPDQM